MSNQLVLDLHLHSRFSRAVSNKINLSTLYFWGRMKGINILSVSDFTHPIWFGELEKELEEVQAGVYSLKTLKRIENENLAMSASSFTGPYFILTTELSCIYSEFGRQRRVHVLICAPDINTVQKINKEFVKQGYNIISDGRPILGISLRNLSELLFNIDSRITIIPAHAWTPWFGVFGSKSGYDSLEEAFGEYSKYIFAIESGLSSDPEMNWRIQELDSRSIVSFSDAHSLTKMAREATVLQLKNRINEEISIQDITYENIIHAFMKGKKTVFQLSHTIEYYPEEGKYHFTGHRSCNISYSPEQTAKQGTQCPVCGRELTVGVLHKINSLAQKDNKTTLTTDSREVIWTKNENGSQFVHLVPLLEIIAESLHVGVGSKKVMALYEQMITRLGPELGILLEVSLADIKRIVGERVCQGIEKVRMRNIEITPGFDGEYGKVTIWPETFTKKEEQLTMI